MNQKYREELKIISYVPQLEKPNYKLPVGSLLMHTLLVSFIYCILIRTKVIGAKCLKPLNNRFSLMTNYEGSIISVGKSIMLWASLLGKILLQNKVIDFGKYGRRKENKHFEKLVKLISIVLILTNSIRKTREIYYSPSWLIYGKTSITLFAICIQYILGGLALLVLDEIQTIYGLNSIKYHLMIDCGYSFWNWFKNFKTAELESGFNPYFTLAFSLFVSIFAMLMFRKKQNMKLEYLFVTHNYYNLEIPFMLGDTNTLFILSTFKEGINGILNMIESTHLINLSYYLQPVYTFLRSNECFYYYGICGNYGYILSEVLYITLIFFLINYLWLVLTNIGGPEAMIKQLDSAKLKPIGGKSGYNELQKSVGPMLYKLYYMDAVRLYVFVLVSNTFALIGRSNNASFLIFILSITQLWNELKEHIPEYRFNILKSKIFTYI